MAEGFNAASGQSKNKNQGGDRELYTQWDKTKHQKGWGMGRESICIGRGRERAHKVCPLNHPSFRLSVCSLFIYPLLYVHIYPYHSLHPSDCFADVCLPE